jgi:hypothetical protein
VVLKLECLLNSEEVRLLWSQRVMKEQEKKQLQNYQKLRQFKILVFPN